MSKKIKITIEVIDTETDSSSSVSSFESSVHCASSLERIDEAEELFLSAGYTAMRQALSSHLSEVSKKSHRSG